MRELIREACEVGVDPDRFQILTGRGDWEGLKMQIELRRAERRREREKKEEEAPVLERSEAEKALRELHAQAAEAAAALRDSTARLRELLP